MKRIKLISTPLTNTNVPEGFLLDYRREFLRLVELIPEGITAMQMGAAISVARKLQQTEEGGYLLLEEHEWEYLRARLSAAKFTMAAPEIVVMVSAVELAKDVDASHLQREASA